MERILLKRIHATIPEPLYNKLIEMNEFYKIDEIVTRLLYEYCEKIERNGDDKNEGRFITKRN